MTPDRPRSTVFVGISVDGFMARPDGRFDFLPEEPEEHGFEAFMATVDALVMGRNTFEVVLPFETWPYGKTRVVVLSTRTLDLSPAIARGAVVDQMSGTPEEIVERLDPMVEAGIDYFITYLPRIAYDPTPVERFATEVVPNVG